MLNIARNALQAVGERMAASSFARACAANVNIGTTRHKLVASHASRGQRPGRAAGSRRHHLLPAGHRPRQRHRPGPGRLPGPGDAATAASSNSTASPGARCSSILLPLGEQAGRMTNSPQLRVWLVDDDASIRWVLERALTQRGMVPRAFESAEPALAALRERDARRADDRHPHAGQIGTGPAARGPRRASGPAGHRHDGAFGPAAAPCPPTKAAPSNTCRSPSTSTRPWTWCGAPAQVDGAPARSRADAADSGVAGQGAGHAAGVSRHRPPVALQRDGADHRRIRHRQGAGRARAARAQPARQQAVHRAEHLGDSRPNCSNRNCSATRRARSPARTPCAAAASSRPTAARCSSTRSATCRPPLQTRLLRVLAEGEFYRVGGQTPIKVDVRVIAATHQNLEERVSSAACSAKISIHRLNVIRIELPPLRARARRHPDTARRTTCAQAAEELGVETKTLAPMPLERAAAPIAGRATCASW